MEMMTAPGQPTYDAWKAGCTCFWLRGFGVDDRPEVWEERIISTGEGCPIHKEDKTKWQVATSRSTST